MGVSAPAYGATGRVWSHHRFGVQMEITHDVLDSIDKGIRPFKQARYRWLRLQSPRNPKHWETVRSMSA